MNFFNKEKKFLNVNFIYMIIIKCIIFIKLIILFILNLIISKFNFFLQ